MPRGPGSRAQGAVGPDPVVVLVALFDEDLGFLRFYACGERCPDNPQNQPILPKIPGYFQCLNTDLRWSVGP